MNENGWGKVARKLKEEPLVPLGIALPTALSPLTALTRPLQAPSSPSLPS